MTDNDVQVKTDDKQLYSVFQYNATMFMLDPEKNLTIAEDIRNTRNAGGGNVRFILEDGKEKSVFVAPGISTLLWPKKS